MWRRVGVGGVDIEDEIEDDIEGLCV